MKSTAALLTGIGSEFTIEEIDIEGPRAGEVLVQIVAAGLCHTDLAARDGILPIEYPGVVGHEGAGTVIAIGEGVTKVAIGDKVSMTFNSCGHCRTCTTGRQSYCENFNAENYGGVRADGSKPLSKDGQPVGGMFFGQSSFGSVALGNERNVVKIDATSRSNSSPRSVAECRPVSVPSRDRSRHRRVLRSPSPAADRSDCRRSWARYCRSVPRSSSSNPPPRDGNWPSNSAPPTPSIPPRAM